MKQFALVFVLALFACQKSQSPWVECSQSNDDMHMQFVIKHDGTMMYRGGMDVIAERNTWTCKLSQLDMQNIQKLLSSLNMEPIGSEQFVIVDGKQMYGDEQYSALLSELRTVTSSRFDAVIDSLPKPTAGVLIHRSIEGQRYEQEEHQSAE